MGAHKLRNALFNQCISEFYKQQKSIQGLAEWLKQFNACLARVRP
jgi:hypothetical protein